MHKLADLFWQGNFTNAFSSNLKTVNLNIKGYTPEDKALANEQNCGIIYS